VNPGRYSTGGTLGRALLVLAPLVIAALATGNPAWLRAGLVTISSFIAMERSGLTPLGVLLHGLIVIACFLSLLLALAAPPLFVLLCAALAAGSILVTARGAKLRSLGNFTFIPALYLACETSENLSVPVAIMRGLHFLPYAAVSLLPVLALSLALQHRRHEDGARLALLRHIDLGARKPCAASVIAVTLAVATAAALVEWRHMGNGQWVIWSAASLVTGDYVSAGAKLRKRGLGALFGVPGGVLIGQLLPRNPFTFDLTVLASTLTLVAFRSYIAGFTTRCMFIAIAFIVAGDSIAIAAERVVNVIAGGLIGYAFVFAVHAAETLRKTPRR
jgi:hypothetical protein